jgi:hypothetical protein
MGIGRAVKGASQDRAEPRQLFPSGIAANRPTQRDTLVECSRQKSRVEALASQDPKSRKLLDTLRHEETLPAQFALAN